MSLGLAPVTSIACSLPSETVKTVRPSVLMMSGSSTPASWTLVCEKSGVAVDSRDGGDASAPWLSAVGAGIAGLATAMSGPGLRSTCACSTPARVGTPVRPPVRRALRRA